MLVKFYVKYDPPYMGHKWVPYVKLRVKDYDEVRAKALEIRKLENRDVAAIAYETFIR